MHDFRSISEPLKTVHIQGTSEKRTPGPEIGCQNGSKKGSKKVSKMTLFPHFRDPYLFGPGPNKQWGQRGCTYTIQGCQNGSKWVQMGAKMSAKWMQKRVQNGSKWVPKGCQMVLNWCQMGAKWVPKGVNGCQMGARRVLRTRSGAYGVPWGCVSFARCSWRVQLADVAWSATSAPPTQRGGGAGKCSPGFIAFCGG